MVLWQFQGNAGVTGQADAQGLEAIQPARLGKGVRGVVKTAGVKLQMHAALGGPGREGDLGGSAAAVDQQFRALRRVSISALKWMSSKVVFKSQGLDFRSWACRPYTGFAPI